MPSRRFDLLSKKRVSYILATKNRAKYLDKALDAYRRLVRSQDELIIVDGASSDNTGEIIFKYRDLVDIFISEPDISATNAFNKGILLAHGKYVKNLNDDDEIYPKEFEKAITIMEKHPEVDLLVCGGTKENNGKRSLVYLPKGINYGKNCEDVFRYGACGVGFIIRRSSIARFGLCPEKHASDAAWALRFISGGGVVKFCRIKLFNHPIYSHSMVVAKNEAAKLETFRLMKQFSSNWFYIRYRFGALFSYHPISLEKVYRVAPVLRIILSPGRFLYRRFMNIVVLQNQKANPRYYLWDGGFS